MYSSAFVPLLQSFFLSLVTPTALTSSSFTAETGYSHCPCTHPLDCATLPAYGENPLDILMFGTHQPCPRWGEIRCCPRNPNPALEDWMMSQDEKIRKSRTKGRKSNRKNFSRYSKGTGKESVNLIIRNETGFDASSGCGCVPKGICNSGNETNSCGGNFEVCCIGSRSEPASLLRTPVSSKPVNPSFPRPSPIFKPKLPKCVEKLRCKLAYGINPYDISVYGPLQPCSDPRTILCLTEHENEMSEFQRYDQLNLTDPNFVRDVVRASPIPANGQTSRNIEPVYRGPSEQRDLESLTSLSELKSIPPRIYVENGTLFISGGSPVIYLPSPVTLPPSFGQSPKPTTSTTRFAAWTASPYTSTVTTTQVSLTSTSSVPFKTISTSAPFKTVTTTTASLNTTTTATLVPFMATTLTTIKTTTATPITSSRPSSTRSTSKPAPKFTFETANSKGKPLSGGPSTDDMLSFSKFNNTTVPMFFSDFEKQLNVTMTPQVLATPVIITAKTSVSKTSASKTSSGKKVSSSRPSVPFTTTQSPPPDPVDVKMKPPFFVKTQEGIFNPKFNKTEVSAIVASVSESGREDVEPANATNAAGSDADQLDSSLDILRTISKFLLRNNETTVVLTNGQQKLNFSVARDKFLNFLGIFSDARAEQSR